MGEVILSATVSGSFGNSQSTTSATTPVIVDGIQVAFCDDGSFGGPNTGCQGFSWSFPFASANFSLLADGSALLTGDFITGLGAVRLGPTTLSITTGVIPEPSAAALLGLGLLGLRAFSRRLAERRS